MIPELEPAIRAVETACRLTEAVRRALSSADAVPKKDRSPVTAADFGAQALICLALAESFPEDPIMAEENLADLERSGLRDRVLGLVRAVRPELDEAEIVRALGRSRYELDQARRFWTVDPVDGTRGFIRGDQYCSALALIEDGRPVLGVLGCPRLGLLESDPEESGLVLAAVRGRGAFELRYGDSEARPVSVSKNAPPEKTLLCESVEPTSSDQVLSAGLRSDLGLEARPWRLDSQVKYACAARGRAEIYLRLPLKREARELIWDHSAGSLLVEEAGGRVSDLFGRPLDFSSGKTMERGFGILATNGRVHDLCLKALAERLNRT